MLYGNKRCVPAMASCGAQLRSLQRYRTRPNQVVWASDHMGHPMLKE